MPDRELRQMLFCPPGYRSCQVPASTGWTFLSWDTLPTPIEDTHYPFFKANLWRCLAKGQELEKAGQHLAQLYLDDEGSKPPPSKVEKLISLVVALEEMTGSTIQGMRKKSRPGNELRPQSMIFWLSSNYCFETVPATTMLGSSQLSVRWIWWPQLTGV